VSCWANSSVTFAWPFNELLRAAELEEPVERASRAFPARPASYRPFHLQIRQAPGSSVLQRSSEVNGLTNHRWIAELLKTEHQSQADVFRIETLNLGNRSTFERSFELISVIIDQGLSLEIIAHPDLLRVG
jgi:hypothetical protein